MYTVDDFEEAKEELEKVAELWSRAHVPAKPNEYDVRAKAASKKLAEIEQDLKHRGVIQYTQHELLEDILDQNFPNAQSNELVSYEGQTFRKKFWPLEKSKTGKTVKTWATGWQLINNKPA